MSENLAFGTLSINFTEPDPAPRGGYTVKFRKVGDPDYQTFDDSKGNPTVFRSSPVLIPFVEAGNTYEGFIQSNCTSGVLCDEVYFITEVIELTGDDITNDSDLENSTVGIKYKLVGTNETGGNLGSGSVNYSLLTSVTYQPPSSQGSIPLTRRLRVGDEICVSKFIRMSAWLKHSGYLAKIGPCT